MSALLAAFGWLVVTRPHYVAMALAGSLPWLAWAALAVEHRHRQQTGRRR